MKKIFISIAAALLFCLSSFAAVISSDQAASYAKKFFNSSSVSLVATGNEYYVFNNAAGGWVMISAEDAATPVIGFDRSGSYKTVNIPGNLKYRLDLREKNIVLARKKGLKQNSAIRSQWENVGLRTKGGNTVYLETAEWGQDYPYNMYCPTVTGESGQAVTGCVATAMSITLNYIGWPEQGKGTLEDYEFEYKTDKYYTVKGYSIEGKVYDYANMPKSGSSNWTSTQKKAVAELMHDCGVMVKMSYSYEGSGAYSADIIPALSKYMSYSAGARELYRSSFNQTDWFKYIKAELDANRPIIYGGANTDDEGHQFVVDGYDADGFVHVNWGWEGSNNGWFMMNALDSGDYGLFNVDDSGIFGLTKDSAGADKSNGGMIMMNDVYGTTSYDGITLVSGQIEPGEKFSLRVGAICNMTESTCSTQVKLCVVDIKGNVKYDLTEAKDLALEGGYETFADYDNIQITQEPEVGDHISMYYKLHNGEWHILPGCDSFSAYYYEAYGDNCLGIDDMPILLVKDSYKAGEVFYFNNIINGHKTVTDKKYYYDGKSNADGNVTLTKGTHTVKVVLTFYDNTTTTLQQKITVE